MKTTYEVGSYVRRFSTKTILGALFLTSVASVTGCSDGSSLQAVPEVSCELASTSFISSSVQVGVRTNAGASPDVSIRGAGFPPGAKVSIGYFGLPAAKVNDPTVDLSPSEPAASSAEAPCPRRSGVRTRAPRATQAPASKPMRKSVSRPRIITCDAHRSRPCVLPLPSLQPYWQRPLVSSSR